ncbi:AIPR family protein [Acholeplasma equirhinis]|uniref:AIPR family protein n=1 Tax=Acholeplasma equirhinis TaxID=555393 RepID=UPI00197AE75C|nr:AIPR family protein [Acholeplasma equirhinis]MBN3489930.1 AIPR family protein [Acholeplasma equirhinis]
MFSKYYEELVDLYFENDYTVISYHSPLKDLLPRLFLYYQIFNADQVKIDELEEIMIHNAYIQAILPSEIDEQTFDVYATIEKEDLEPSKIISKLDKIDKLIISALTLSNNDTRLVRERLLTLNAINHDELRVVLLSDAFLDFKFKSELKDVITNYKSQLSTISYNIIFGEDVEEFIYEIDAPTLYVKDGQLELMSDTSLIHGEEKSLVTSISAKSLKNVFQKSANHGLFASNLRYYVKSAKIDENIKYTIQEEPDKFWYFNNGITITCEDYWIERNIIHLINFSIVNGGQTTNLIGNTQFEEDFPLLCKIIKPKYQNYDDNLMFLTKIAETSNTQKPIKTKDLIANRIDQHKLKRQMSDIGIYLQIKRGEKINKSIYKEPWQNATNDELGQMIFSFVYQHPGLARNSKNKMLSHEPYYKKIYKNKYSSDLLKSFQYLKVEYHRWKNAVAKNYDNPPEMIGMAKNGFFWMLGVLGFLTKMYYNDQLRYQINKEDTLFPMRTNDFMPFVSQNDIGQIKLLKDYNSFVRRSSSYPLFDFIFNDIIVPTYIKFKQQNPAFAYSNFTKNDTNYYKHVLPFVTLKYRADSKYGYEILNKYFEPKSDENCARLLTLEEIEEVDKPELTDLLKEYRKRKWIEGNKELPAYFILTNAQIDKVSSSLPRTTQQLIFECKLNSIQVNKYGSEILEIVSRYLPK